MCNFHPTFLWSSYGMYTFWVCLALESAADGWAPPRWSLAISKAYIKGRIKSRYTCGGAHQLEQRKLPSSISLFEWTNLSSRFSFSSVSSVISPEPRKWMSLSIFSFEFCAEFTLEPENIVAVDTLDWLCKPELNNPGMLVLRDVIRWDAYTPL